MGKGAIQGLKHTLSSAKIYSINFIEHNKKYCFSLHYNAANSYLFFNGTEFHNFKAKDSEILSSNSIMFSRHFKRLVSRSNERDRIKRICL